MNRGKTGIQATSSLLATGPERFVCEQASVTHKVSCFDEAQEESNSNQASERVRSRGRCRYSTPYDHRNWKVYGWSSDLIEKEVRWNFSNLSAARLNIVQQMY